MTVFRCFGLLGSGNGIRLGRLGAVALVVGLGAAACDGSTPDETSSVTVSDESATSTDEGAGAGHEGAGAGHEDAGVGHEEMTPPRTTPSVDAAVAPSQPAPGEGDAAVSSPGAATLDGGVSADPSAAPPPVASSDNGTLVIPLRPLTESALSVTLDTLVEPEMGLTSSVNPTLTFGWGPEYPTRVRFTLQDSMIALPSSPFLFGPPEPLVLTGARSDSTEVEVAFVDGSAFDVEVTTPGTFTIGLEGKTQVEDDSVPETWSLAVTVEVAEVASVTWSACGESPPYVLSGAGIRSSVLQVWDAFGERLQLSNASYTRPVTVTVEALPGTELSTIDGLAHLVATGPAQTIALGSATGALGNFHLLGVDAVDGLEAYYFMCATWTRGIELEMGRSTSAIPSVEEPGRISITPYLKVGDQRVCSVPTPELFSVATGNSATCGVAPESADGPLCSANSDALPTEVLAQAAGECQIRLTAPDANGGLGVTSVLDFVFGAVTR